MARKTIKQMREEEEEIISQVSKKRKSKAMIKSIIQKYRN
jgi:hypothetical protein